MLKKFNDLSPLHFYRYICKDVELSVLKEMPDDKLYIYCEDMTGSKDKELIACADDKRLIEYSGFSLSEAEDVVEVASSCCGRMRWLAIHEYFKHDIQDNKNLDP